MSTTIDQKVVEMRFDNRHFETNARESMSTLEKLKQKLNLSGASKGLENLNTSANKVNMNGLSSALDTVHSKFSAMEIVGITALANITNSAVNAGKRMVESLTIAPVRDGFNEYELMLNSIQTTMAGTGKTAKEVEEQLKSLDDYADKTVYSTADMLNNLPKFTNAGVDLEKATVAMIGIANATALAGGDASKASIAFYNLGQSIGTGYLSRMDYNSINNAGIATMEWKEQMVEAAIAAGTLKKVGEDSYKAGKKTFTLQQLFIDGLQEQWATTDVMMKVFQDYGDETTEIGKKAYSAAQDIKTFSQMMESLKATAGTGWKDTWQIIFGDLDEAKELWTGLTNFISGIITGMANFRNKILEGALGKSFKGLFDKIKEPFNAIEKTVKNVKDYAKVVDEIINGKWGNGQKRWDALTKAGYDWKHAQNLVNEELGFSLRRSTDYKEAQKEVAKSQEKVNEATADYIVDLVKLSDAQLKEKGYTDEQIKAFRELEKVSKQTGIPLKQFIENIDEIDGRWILLNSFKNIGQGLVAVFGAMKDAWLDIFPVSGAANGLFNIIAAFHKFTTYLTVSKEAADKLRRTFKGLFAVLDIVLTIIAGPIKLAFKIFLQLLDALGIGMDGILSFTAKLGDGLVAVHDWFESIFDFSEVFAYLAPHIKKAAKAFGEWVVSLKDSKVVKWIAEHLVKAKDATVEWFKSLKDSELLKRFVNYLKNSKEAISEWFKGLKETDNIPKYIFQGLINGLKAGIGDVLGVMIEFGQKIISSICKVLGIESPSKVFFGIGKNIVEGLYNGISSIVKMVYDLVMSVGGKLIEIIKNLDIGSIFTIAIGTGVTFAFVKIAKALDALSSPLESIDDLIKESRKTLKSFRGLLNTLKFKIAADAIKSIAIAVAILAGSIIALTFVDTEKMWHAVAAIGILMLVLTGLTAAAGYFSKNQGKILELGKISLTLIALGIAMGLMAKAMKTVSSIAPEQYEQAIHGFGVLILSILSTMIVISQGGPAFSRAGSVLTSLGIALLLMATTVKILGKMDPEQLHQGGRAIGMFSLIIVGLMAATRLIAGSKNVDKIGKTISKIAAALLMMIIVAKIAGKMNPDELRQGGRAIAMFSLIIIGLMAATRLISGSNNVGKIGKTIFGISAALLMMIFVAKLAAAMDPKDLQRGGRAIAMFSLIIIGLMAATRLIAGSKNVDKIGKTILMLSVSIGLLAITAALLSLMDVDSLKKGITAVAVLAIIAGLLVGVTHFAKNVTGTIIAITAAIAVLAGAVALLTLIDPMKLAGATGCITALVGAFAILVAATGKTKKAMSTLIILTAAIAVLAGAIFLIAQLPASNAIASAASLSLLLGTLAGVLAVIGKMKVSTKTALNGVVGLVALCIPLYLLIGALKLMNNLENTVQNAIALGILMGTLVAVLALCVAVGALYTATGGVAMAGILAIGALIVEIYLIIGALALMSAIPDAEANLNALSRFLIVMAGVLTVLAIVGPLAIVGVVAIGALISMITIMGVLAAAIGWLMAQFPQIEEFVNKGIPMMIKLAGGVGEMIGAFVSGVITKISGSLPEIGTNLSMFMANAMPFIVGAKLVDEKVLAGVAILAGAILALTAVNLIEGIASLLSFGSSFADLGTELSKFMINALPFIANAMLLTPEVVQSIKLLAEAILILTAANIIEGISRFLGGESSLEKFGSQLKFLGQGLREFVDEIGPITPEQVESAKNAAEVIKTLASAAKQIPNTGGLLGQLVGENDMGPWAEQLPNVATGIVGFITKITDAKIGSESIDAARNAAEVIKVLAQAASEIPNTGGLLASLIGDNDLATFAEGLPTVGSGIVKFINALLEGNVTQDTVNMAKIAAEVIGVLAGVAQDIPNTGGFLASLFGDNDLTDFAEKLPDVGKAIADYAKKLGTFGTDKLNSVKAGTDAIKAFAQLGKIDLEVTGNGLSSFGDKMITFAGKLKTFANEMAGISAESITEAGNKIRELVDIISDVAVTDIGALQKFGDSLKEIGIEGVKGFVKAYTELAPPLVKDAVGTMMEAVIDGAESKQSDVEAAFKVVAEAAVDATCTTSLVNSITQAGKDLAAGFANGIQSKSSLNTVAGAGTAIGKAALKAAKAAIKSNSPSKEAMKIGNFFGQGLVIGINDYETQSYDAGYGIADRAKEGLSRAISKVSNIISNGIDSQPTIRPVLDLSEVESGAGYLNTMFNDPSVGVMTNLNAISHGMNTRIQNGTNNDVVSAINKLRKDLGNVSGTTNNYNVNGVTYDDGSNITEAVRTLVRAAKVERRV